MKKTYVTTMPNHIGAFLQASRCFARLGVNICRVSYNKAVDIHTLFIDAEGTPEQLRQADIELERIGYLQKVTTGANIILIEFRIPDSPGSAISVLELIESFHFNISYMSAQQNNSPQQLFKMGLFVENPEDVKAFLKEAEKICQIRVIDYNHSEKVFDNSIFYNSFVSGLVESLGISKDMENELLVNANLAMQTLDEQGLSPYRTFDSISRFAELLAACKGEAFSPRISRHSISESTELTLIEPPCGSNTAILKCGDEVLFVDSGYSCYREEMLSIFRKILPDFDARKKRILITHADVDHCGLLDLFDEVIASRKSAECLRLEAEGKAGFREQNYLHKPYIRICKALTSYPTVDPERVTAPWGMEAPGRQPLQQIGFFDFADLHFEVYEGQGGHLPGEIVLIDYEHHIVFTGDIYINIPGMTSEQRQYNRYAPILMTSVDTDPQLCAREREAIMQRLGTGKWQIFGAHGYKKDYDVSAASGERSRG
ncbi:MAG: MBL fold metallo-hydrolase [Clostridia bacterium]|nr:MBL fold metallo-hydrolase [Clostridia bacterium]